MSSIRLIPSPLASEGADLVVVDDAGTSVRVTLSRAALRALATDATAAVVGIPTELRTEP